MIDMSVTLIAFLGFAAVILAICGITYLNADKLEAFLNRKFTFFGLFWVCHYSLLGMSRSGSVVPWKH